MQYLLYQQQLSDSMLIFFGIILLFTFDHAYRA